MASAPSSLAIFIIPSLKHIQYDHTDYSEVTMKEYPRTQSSGKNQANRISEYRIDDLNLLTSLIM